MHASLQHLAHYYDGDIQFAYIDLDTANADNMKIAYAYDVMSSVPRSFLVKD